MSEKRFTIKSTATELELYDNGVKIGEFPHYEWVARPVDYVVKTLNEQQNIINILLECLYVAEDTVINEYSSHIGEDMEKLDKIFKDRDIGEIRKFVLGADEDE